ncbi:MULTISPECIES: helix-turn-helix domain-containing protein [Aneurinibacillus]|nr:MULTISPECIES: helix-turn-helix transcriptional regulator [Aneurinibacillus]MED0677687.1 helix-turn-helix transcriptional regulator [Aneurinibacillus thermoaerophilus]MED0681434.1 helix-turn-helix transcriptional regulator [Aneurinibacillus thermoaerophilus]MED0737836.1 helix-turn-helix transcriptional regulator [Aneurinibacillus thermoaerophilus]MED0766373.1 helix-turn-helix transcriptional regulator [Aneurinibacillus thermoaerophilus]
MIVLAKMTLGERIKYLREKNGYAQKFVAEKIGVRNNTLSSYESDKRQPDYDTLQKIADFFEVSVDYLLGRTDDPSPKEDKKMNLFFYDGLEGYDDLTPEEQKAFREHMYEEAKQAIELVKKLKKK